MSTIYIRSLRLLLLIGLLATLAVFLSTTATATSVTTTDTGFIGGTAGDSAYAVAIDDMANIYIVGATNSLAESFPVAIGPDLTPNGSTDAFITKISPTGEIVYAGYIGGAGSEIAYGVAVSSDGSAYVVGETTSSEASFPVAGAGDKSFAGEHDGFIVRVKPDGSGLDFANYLGGTGFDIIRDVALDRTGNIYVVGISDTPSGFPLAVGPKLRRDGFTSAFISKLLPDGSEYLYSGYIAGSGNGGAFGVAVDSAGAAYVAGAANTDLNFPAVVGPKLTFTGGVQDTWVAKVRPDGTGFIYAGFIGGQGTEETTDIAVDSLGRTYVIGITAFSPDFPITVGPDISFNGDNDGFIARVAADGSRLEYAGYIGGSGPDYAQSVVVDTLDHVFVAGFTASDETTLPVVGQGDLTYNGAIDAYIAQLKEDGSGFAGLSYIGGNQSDRAFGIAANRRGGITVTGDSYSDASSFPVSGSLPSLNRGEGDAFVTFTPLYSVALPLIQR